MIMLQKVGRMGPRREGRWFQDVNPHNYHKYQLKGWCDTTMELWRDDFHIILQISRCSLKGGQGCSAKHLSGIFMATSWRLMTWNLPAWDQVWNPKLWIRRLLHVQNLSRQRHSGQLWWGKWREAGTTFKVSSSILWRLFFVCSSEGGHKTPIFALASVPHWVEINQNNLEGGDQLGKYKLPTRRLLLCQMRFH